MKRNVTMAGLLLALLSPALARAAPAARGKWVENRTGKTVIRKLMPGNDLSVLVISRKGTAVLLDPQYVPVGLAPDFVAVTHRAHRSQGWLEAHAQVPSAVQQAGAWTAGDIRITGVRAPVERGDYVGIVTYVLEVDGLRIAYFSCDNQGPLEPAQRQALGKIDVAILTADNDPPGGRTNISVERTRALARELGAPIVIPLSHHVSDMEYAFDDFSDGKLETVSGQLALDRAAVDGKKGQRFVHVAATGAF